MSSLENFTGYNQNAFWVINTNSPPPPQKKKKSMVKHTQWQFHNTMQDLFPAVH